MILFVVNVKEAISPLVLYEGEKKSCITNMFFVLFCSHTSCASRIEATAGIKEAIFVYGISFSAS